MKFRPTEGEYRHYEQWRRDCELADQLLRLARQAEDLLPSQEERVADETIRQGITLLREFVNWWSGFSYPLYLSEKGMYVDYESGATYRLSDEGHLVRAD